MRRMRLNIRETLLPGMSTEVLFQRIAAGAAAAGSQHHVDFPTPGVLRITWSRNRFRTAGLIGMALMDRTKTVTVISNDSPEGSRVKVIGETSDRFGVALRDALADLASG